jgi:hypothetical protein
VQWKKSIRREEKDINTANINFHHFAFKFSSIQMAMFGSWDKSATLSLPHITLVIKIG